MSIADLRREYNLTGLRRRDLDEDAIVQFRKWFEQATGARKSGRVRKFFINLYKSLLLIRNPELLDMNAMTLATADGQGRPSARVVLLTGPGAAGPSPGRRRRRAPPRRARRRDGAARRRG